jgi:hypothetical protein
MVVDSGDTGKIPSVGVSQLLQGICTRIDASVIQQER